MRYEIVVFVLNKEWCYTHQDLQLTVNVKVLWSCCVAPWTVLDATQV